MNIQRLRNLTTGILHTEIGDVYEDIEYLTGQKDVMTHMLPNASRALEPWLKKKAPDARLWNNEFDTNHLGEIEIDPMNDDDLKEFWERFSNLPSPLERFINKE